MKFFLFVLVISMAVMTTIASDDEWDELEGILDNLESVDKKTFTDDDDDGSDEEKGSYGESWIDWFTDWVIDWLKDTTKINKPGHQ